MAEKQDHLFVAIVFALLLAVVATPQLVMATQSVNVNAIITVTCVFGLTFNSAQSAYVQPTNVALTYSLRTLGPCTQSFINGNVIIKNSTGYPVYSANFLYTNVGQTSFTNTLTLNSIALGHGAFNAYAAFNANSPVPNYNSSSLSLQIYRPANIVLTGLAVSPASSQINSQITVNGYIDNTGDISAGNVILHMLFTAPTSATTSINTSLSSVAPGSNDTFQVSLSNASSAVGAWNVVADVSYNSVYTSGSSVFGSNYLVSDSQTANYSITAVPPKSGSSGPPSSQPIPPSSIGSLSFSQLPIFFGILRGESASTYIGLTNNASRAMWVNITVPQFSPASFTISANSVYLLPKQNLLLTATLRTNSSADYGTYSLPLNVTATVVNGTPARSQLYMGFRVSNTSVKTALTQSVSLFNYSKQAVVSLLIRNPTNFTLYNSTAKIQLPLFIVKSAAQIIPSGQPSTVALGNNAYVITYTVPELAPGQSTTVYYTIRDVVGPEYLSGVGATFVAQTNKLNSTVKLIDTKVPTFYVGQQGTINVTAIYVGASTGNASFSLAGPSSVAIQNPYMQYNVFSNMVLRPSFMVQGIAQPGTYLLTLYTKAPGDNQSYSILIVVLQNSNYTGVVPKITLGNGNFLTALYSANQLVFFLVIGMFVFVIGFSLTLLFRGRGIKRYYRKDRVEKLVRLREQIKRGSEMSEQ